MKLSPLLPFALAATLLLFARTSSADILLSSPSPLTDDDQATSGPCGCYFGAGPETPGEDETPSLCQGDHQTTEVTAGASLEVSWVETVDQQGTFRVSFAEQPVEEVDKADLAVGIVYEEPDENIEPGGTVTATVTVPATPCESCTLQVRQDVAGVYFYSCAAVQILEGGVGGAGQGGAGAGGEASSGTPGATTGTGTPIGDQPPSGSSDGCACRAADSRGGGIAGCLAIGAAVLVFGVRRRSRLA